jgi:hypothetical protein
MFNNILLCVTCALHSILDKHHNILVHDATVTGNLQSNEHSVIFQKTVINVLLFTGKRTVLTFPHLSSMTECA